MVKATSLPSTITIIEVKAVAKKIIAATYQPVEVFLIAGAIYLSINFVLTRLIVLMELWLSSHLSDKAAPRGETLAAR